MNRVFPEPQTIAYMALGAQALLNKTGAPKAHNLDRFDGHVGFIEACVAPAALLDVVADWLQEGNLLDGVFAYEVSEPMGERMAGVLLFPAMYGPAERDGNSPNIEALLEGVLVNAGYPRETARQALEHAQAVLCPPSRPDPRDDDMPADIDRTDPTGTQHA